MATGSNGIATVAECTSKGCTASGYSDTTQCPKYGDFLSCPAYTTNNVTVSSGITYTANSSTLVTVSKIVTTLSVALPFAIYVKYSAKNSSGTTLTKTVTVSAGTTSVTTSSPFSSTVQYNTLITSPTISKSSSSGFTSSLTEHYKYTVSKSQTTTT